MKSSDNQPNSKNLASTILKYLVFGTYAFTLYQVLMGGDKDIPTNRVWIIGIVAIASLLLLAVDRLSELQFSKEGITAKLDQKKADTISEVGALTDNPKIAQEVNQEVLNAKNEQEVQSALEKAVRLNVDRNVELVTQAIQNKEKIFIRYRSVKGDQVENYFAIPLDIKPGESTDSSVYDYLWCYSEKGRRPISLRLDNVISVGKTAETFDPARITDLKGFDAWVIPRNW
ncbi:MAG: hypothetical protein JXA13_14135 [Anaerolineales bacterium]|nr:hypothetical protein [Anaerolineales bacterium]